MKYGYLAIFAIGAAIGSAATWYISKKRYEQAIQEEIDSVKQAFNYKKTVDEMVDGFRKGFKEGIEKFEEKTKNENNEIKEKIDVVEYAKRLNQESYTDYSSKSEEKDEDFAPVVIPPEEFGEYFDYDKISLTYYADHVLVDENDELIEDVEGCVGFDSLNHFGEYEDDSVFVRNDRLKTYYEILLDLRTYSDVIKTKPYLKEE